MVACVIAKWPVLEFAIAVLNDIGANRFAEKVIKRLSLGCVAKKNDDGAVVLYGARTDRFFDAVADTRQCQLSCVDFSLTRGGDQRETYHRCQSQSKHAGLQAAARDFGETLTRRNSRLI